ncbi:MAG: single-stranded DNA-binding protein [Mycobacteriales bacterium]
MTAARARDAAAAPEHRNSVELVGRVSAPAVERVLPSGDPLVTFRLVIVRPDGRGGGGGDRKTYDTIDCLAWRGDVRRMVGGWQAGDVVEVSGALRRRFWRTDHGAESRTEVEVAAGRRLVKAAARQLSA